VDRVTNIVEYKVSAVARSQSTGTIILGNRALFREGVAALLRHTPYKVIASAQRSSELKDVRVPAGSRMLVILGIEDSNGNPSETGENIKALRSLFPGSTIVVIAETRAPTNFQQIIMAAPDGYVANLSSRDVLLKLLDVALLDQQVIVLSQPTASSTLADQSDSTKQSSSGNGPGAYDLECLSTRPDGSRDPQLSQREREILVRLAEGDSNKQIARLCNITESTVKVHLKAILRKITVHNRTQAAIWAIEKGYHVAPHPNDQTLKPMNGNGGRSSIRPQGCTSGAKSLTLALSGK
jgi:two-component system, NarL family, nitrate/nitrite response regulator NarL